MRLTRLLTLLCMCCLPAICALSCGSPPAEPVFETESALTCSDGSTAAMMAMPIGMWSSPFDKFYWTDNGAVVSQNPMPSAQSSDQILYQNATTASFTRTDTSGGHWASCSGTLKKGTANSGANVCPLEWAGVPGSGGPGCIKGCQEIWRMVSGSCHFNNGETFPFPSTISSMIFYGSTTPNTLIEYGNLMHDQFDEWKSWYYRFSSVGQPISANYLSK